MVPRNSVRPLMMMMVRRKERGQQINGADKPKVGTEGREEVDLVYGFPIVSEGFFFRESHEWSTSKIMLHIVGWRGKNNKMMMTLSDGEGKIRIMMVRMLLIGHELIFPMKSCLWSQEQA